MQGVVLRCKSALFQSNNATDREADGIEMGTHSLSYHHQRIPRIISQLVFHVQAENDVTLSVNQQLLLIFWKHLI